MNEEKESRSSAMSEQKRTALLRYMMVLFAVAFLLVLLSYLIQVFNSQNTISQLNATSASALQNAERLQDTNRELTEENKRLNDELDDSRAAVMELTEENQRLQSEIDALNEKNEAQQQEAAADREIAQAEGRAEGLEEGRQAGLAEAQKAYDLLLKAAAATDEAERAKAIEALEDMRGSLSEAAQKQLDALKTPAAAEDPAKTDENNEP